MSHRGVWSVSFWCFVIGCALFVIGLGCTLFILITKGKRRRMTQEELTQSILRDDITDMPAYSVSGPGVGVRVEAEADTNTLREAAARGDWALFWSWPISMVGWFGGFQLMITAFAIGEDAAFLAWICGVFLVPPVLVWIYRPFAVLYGKPPEIDDNCVPDPPRPKQRRA